MTDFDPKPVLYTIDYTEQILADDNTSFEQAGYSFNQAGWIFGGVYGQDGEKAVLEDVN